MDAEQAVKLVQALVWPAVVVFLALYFGTPLRQLIAEIRKGTFEASATGLKGSFERAELAATIGLAEGRRQATESQIEGIASNVGPSDAQASQSIASSVARATEPEALQRYAGARVLWVDDHPENNVYEMRALRTLGTEDALDKVRSNAAAFDVIISDMGRGLDREAGYHLLERLRQLGDRTPFIIYAGSSSAEHRAEAIRRGAAGSTSRPQELLTLVTSALRERVPAAQ